MVNALLSDAEVATICSAGVEGVALEGRAESLATRSLKRTTKLGLLRLAISVLDLTSLEGADTPALVRSLCAKAIRPDLRDLTLPSVAAVCVYPELVAVAHEALAGTGVHLASVAAGFPMGQIPLEFKLREIEAAVAAGADEIDTVLSRNAFLAGHKGAVLDEIVLCKQACGSAHLKVILETSELGSYAAIREAGWLALAAGADFIKTSTGTGTGKHNPWATPATALLLLECVRGFADVTGEVRGVKVSGGVKTAKQALGHLVLVNETVGEAYLRPELFRIGASSLVNDIVLQLHAQEDGGYAAFEEATVV